MDMNFDVKGKIEELVDKIQKDPALLKSFQSDPIKTVEKLLGGPEDALYLSGDDGVIGGHKIATGDPAKGEGRSTYMKQVGLMSQVGFSYGMAVDY